MKIRFTLLLSVISLLVLSQVDKSDWKEGVPEGCTTITVGKSASKDGSVMTSHTDDSHRTRSWMDIIPAKIYKKGDKTAVYKRVKDTTKAMPVYAHDKIGDIPQIESTYQFINTAYPCMNEKQLAIGESTFGGREELQSDAGKIDCQRLNRFMLERCTTAREAIKLADELTKKYGWNDAGECLTIADKKEVWHFEIVGPGKGKIGAVWVAQRVPDGHVSVNANASTIKEININDTDNFMASDNIFDVAKENGWYNSKIETFKFCYAYAPHSRESLASRRREWRVFSLLAPSQHFNAYSENFPFSVKPDAKVTVNDLIKVFQDYYENTPYDMTKNMTITNDSGKTVKSPLANPFMSYDANKLHKINGGWGWLGERTIARWYTMYGTITQSRDWLPDEVGGVVWLAQDNIATSVYVPVYAGVTDLAKSYKTPGRTNGFTRESAWWAFNRLGTLTAQRWGEARYDVRNVFDVMQAELFDNQAKFEKQILNYKDKSQRIKELTKHSALWGNKVVNKAWQLGDDFWTKYDEKF